MARLTDESKTFIVRKNGTRFAVTHKNTQVVYLDQLRNQMGRKSAYLLASKLNGLFEQDEIYITASGHGYEVKHFIKQ